MMERGGLRVRVGEEEEVVARSNGRYRKIN